MNQPFEIHVIESSIAPYQGLQFRIPSPFEDNTTIDVFVEVYRNSHDTIYVEMWSELPSIRADMLKHRVKLASDELPFAPKEKITFGEMIEAMIQTITESEFMRNGTRILFGLHEKFRKMEI